MEEAISFVIDASWLSAWERENLSREIMEQGKAQQIETDAEVNGVTVTVTVSGAARGWLCAYEAAIQSWALGYTVKSD